MVIDNQLGGSQVSWALHRISIQVANKHHWDRWMPEDTREFGIFWQSARNRWICGRHESQEQLKERLKWCELKANKPQEKESMNRLVGVSWGAAW